jgi:hypothetical protein
VSRGIFNRDVIGLYSAVPFKEGLLGGRRRVALNALYYGGAVYLHLDLAGVNG